MFLHVSLSYRKLYSPHPFCGSFLIFFFANLSTGTMQVFTIACLVTFLWLSFGYSLAFSPVQLNGHVNEVYGNAERLWLRGMMLDTTHALAPTIPEAIFCAYQLTFAIITAGLICGSFADRMKYHSMMIFIAFWHLIVYCPIAHSNWHPQGWLYRLGNYHPLCIRIKILHFFHLYL